MSQTTPYDLTTDIAVIGCAGYFPGAANTDEFWRNIASGIESVADFTDAALRQAGVTLRDLNDERYVRRGVVLQGHDCFDASYFGYVPREAETMNPAQRLLLQSAHLALEDAGYDPAQYAGRIGTFVGVGGHYLMDNLLTRPDVIRLAGEKMVQFGNDPAFAATHLAYRLRLRGPAVGLNTACSTSLVAVHMACRSLLDCESEIAIAGGANIAGNHGRGYIHRDGGILARDGHCRPFDSAASGTVSSSGAGIVVLKRLEDALADGDRILAVVKSTAINNDGADKVGFAAPGVQGQLDVISAALEQAQIDPTHIGFHETHGTGTALGDPIEIEAATLAHRRRTQATAYCALGALKANVGHMGTASGIGGFIKACHALSRQTIPPLVNFREINPALQLNRTPFRIPTRAEPWQRTDRPRYASVSAFGMGGTNAHAVLGEAPLAQSHASTRRWHVWPVSGQATAPVSELKQRLHSCAEQLSDAERADAAFTLTVGRRVLNQRDYLLVPDAGAPSEAALRVHPGEASKRIAMVFPGQGAQFACMAHELHSSEPAYRDALEECLDRFALAGDSGLDLRGLLLNETCKEFPSDTRAVQAALFATSYASARMWEHYGLRPQAFLGHSIGEYVAACVTGALSLESAIALVMRRAALMHAAPPGRMLAVNLDGEKVQALLDPELGVDIAAINAPTSCVVSGTEAQLSEFDARLRERGVSTTWLKTDRAFHSRMMDSAAVELARFCSNIQMSEPRVPFISNVTGDWITAKEWSDPGYWARHLRSPVRFSTGVARLQEAGFGVVIDAGPGQSMTRLLRSTPACHDMTIVPTCRHHQGTEDDQRVLSSALGAMWAAGLPIDLRSRYASERRGRAKLPQTVLTPARFWIERGDGKTASLSSADAESDPASPSEHHWFYLPTWQREPREEVTADAERKSWLIFGDDDPVFDALAVRVRAAGGVCVHAGETGETAEPESIQMLLRNAAAHAQGCVLVYACTRDRPADLEDEQPLTAFLQVLKDCAPQLAARKARLLCVTRDGAAVAGEAIQPSRAMLASATSVVSREWPTLTTTWVDIDRHDAVANAGFLLAEAGSSAPAVLTRRGRRWTPKFLRRSPAPVSSFDLHEHGCYVITGGLGGIGLAIATHFATRKQVKLVLIGRTEFPARSQWLARAQDDDPVAATIRTLLSIERLGSEVMVCSADVSDAAAMSAVAESSQTRFGPCRGIVHAAGLVGGSLITRLEPAALDEVLAPKVRGTRVLDHLWPFHQLDFVLLCSSQNALKGSGGRFAYSAANAFLDAFAEWHRSQCNRTVVRSINWCAWRDVGMAARSGRSDEAARARMLANGEAMTVLALAAGSDEPRWALSKVPLESVLEATEDVMASTALAPAPAVVQLRQTHLRSAGTPPRGDLEELIARTWTEVIGVTPIGRDDDFFELGGTSLTLMQVGMRLQEKLDIPLAAHELFAALTVSALASELQPRLSPSSNGDPSEEAALVAALEHMSSSEIDNMISRFAEER